MKLPVIFKSGERKGMTVVYDGPSEHDALVRALSRLDAEDQESERLPALGFCGLDCGGSRWDCCKIRPRPFIKDQPKSEERQA